MQPGKLISIEGSEGAGKSTARQFIADYFSQHQIPLLVTREPGGTEIAEQIRHILLQPRETEILYPETELLLMFASRYQHIQHKIKPALAAGQWVLTDRYIDASYAYQGGGRAIAKKYITELDAWLVGGLYPDLTILFDIPAALGCQRALERSGAKDRIETEKTAFFERVCESYLARATADPKRIKIIRATDSISEVQKQIEIILHAFTAGKI